MTPEVDVKPDVEVKDESVTKTPRSEFTQPSFIQNSPGRMLPIAPSDSLLISTLIGIINQNKKPSTPRPSPENVPRSRKNP
jgi:hypothetical protein